MQLKSALQRAATLLQSRKTADCSAVCRQILASQPQQRDALQLLALAAQQEGRHDDAEALFRKCLALEPRRTDFLVNFGVFLRTQRRDIEARKVLRRAAKTDPNAIKALFQLSLLEFANDALVDAKCYVRKVIQAVPRQATAWELLAAVEQRMGNAPAAIRACRQGLEHKPDAPRLLYSLAQLLREEQNFLGAAENYERALKAGFEEPQLYCNLAESYLESGDAAAAVTAARAGTERLPHEAALQKTYARLHWELQLDGDPLARLKSAAKNHPQNPALWQTLLELLNRMGRHEDSRQVLREAYRLGCPRTPEVLMLDAMNLARLNNADPAIESLEELLLSHPGHDGIKLNLAELLLSHGRPERASQICMLVLQHAPLDQLALAYLATAWQMLGDPREHDLVDYQAMVTVTRIEAPGGYADIQNYMAEVRDVLETLHRTQAHPIDQTLRGGTQTNGHLFKVRNRLLRELGDQVLEAVALATRRFPVDKDHPYWSRGKRHGKGSDLKFAGAWSVRLRGEGYHTNHIHPEGWISSALYVSLPPSIQSDSVPAGCIQFGVPSLTPATDIPPKRIVKPEIGTMVLFPSYMWHGTVPFVSQEPRITIAFDVVPRL